MGPAAARAASGEVRRALPYCGRHPREVEHRGARPPPPPGSWPILKGGSFLLSPGARRVPARSKPGPALALPRRFVHHVRSPWARPAPLDPRVLPPLPFSPPQEGRRARALGAGPGTRLGGRSRLLRTHARPRGLQPHPDLARHLPARSAVGLRRRPNAQPRRLRSGSGPLRGHHQPERHHRAEPPEPAHRSVRPPTRAAGERHAPVPPRTRSPRSWRNAAGRRRPSPATGSSRRSTATPPASTRSRAGSANRRPTTPSGATSPTWFPARWPGWTTIKTSPSSWSSTATTRTSPTIRRKPWRDEFAGW